MTSEQGRQLQGKGDGSQALLHDPGEALVVQAHQGVVHALQHWTQETEPLSGERLTADSEAKPPGPGLHQP